MPEQKVGENQVNPAHRGFFKKKPGFFGTETATADRMHIVTGRARRAAIPHRSLHHHDMPVRLDRAFAFLWPLQIAPTHLAVHLLRASRALAHIYRSGITTINNSLRLLFNYANLFSNLIRSLIGIFLNIYLQLRVQLAISLLDTAHREL